MFGAAELYIAVLFTSLKGKPAVPLPLNFGIILPLFCEWSKLGNFFFSSFCSGENIVVFFLTLHIKKHLRASACPFRIIKKKKMKYKKKKTYMKVLEIMIRPVDNHFILI